MRGGEDREGGTKDTANNLSGGEIGKKTTSGCARNKREGAGKHKRKHKTIT
jgi:hypothetical protein